MRHFHTFVLQLVLLLLLPTAVQSTKVHVTPLNNEGGVDAESNDSNEDCRWGEPCYTNESSSTAPSIDSSEGSNNNNSNNNNNNNNKKEKQQSVPFLRTTPPVTKKHDPPSGFILTARVYTSEHDKMAHFDTTELTLDFLTCGVAGSTTSGIPIQHAYFRHALSSSKPAVYQGTEYGPHPQLLIALSTIKMELNSGETRNFNEGSVVLLEDVVSGGHKLTSPNDGDVLVLLLTLPQHYHYVGKERTSLPNGQRLQCKEDGTLHRKLTRKYILGGIGVGFTLIIADWMGKVAPLWLSVGIGGGCFVVGGTWLLVEGGDRLVDSIEYMVEQRRMKQEGEVDALEMKPMVMDSEPLVHVS